MLCNVDLLRMEQGSTTLTTQTPRFLFTIQAQIPILTKVGRNLLLTSQDLPLYSMQISETLH